MQYEYCFWCDTPCGTVGIFTRGSIGPIYEKCLDDIVDTGISRLGTDNLLDYLDRKYEKELGL